MNNFTKISIIASLLCCNIQLYAQEICGKLINSSKDAVTGATIILQNNDSTYVDASVSDDNGNFYFKNIDKIDEFNLLIQHISYKPLSIRCYEHNVGTIELSHNIVGIEELIVEGKKTIVTIESGKLKYNIKNISDKYITNNAYETICKLPVIQEKNGQLSLIGATDVNVIFNGKPSTLSQEQITDILKNTSTAQIKSVEVMYNTSPEYHTRGASINIITDKVEKKTFKTEISTTYNNQYFSSYNGNINFLIAKDKSSLNFSYTPRYSHNMNLLDLNSEHTYQGDLYDISHSQSLVYKGLKHNIYVEYDYDINDNNKVSIGYNGSYSNNAKELIKVNGNYQNSTNEIKKDNRLHNIFARYSSDLGLDIGIDYTNYNLNASNVLESDLNINELYLLNYITKQKIQKVSIYADQSHELNNDWIFKYGGYYKYTENLNNQTFINIKGKENVENSDSKLYEQISNLYVGVDKEFDTGLSFSLSATAEYYSIGDYNKWTVYPQANITYSPNENHTFMLGLSTEKDYPAYWDMMNSITYMNAYEEMQTTIGLKPATIYSVNANYLFKQKYMLSLFYENTSAYFSMDMYQSKDKLALIYKTQNWDYYKTLGLSLNIPFNIGNHISSDVSVSLLNDKNKSDNHWDIPFNRKKWVYMITNQNNLKINSSLRFSFDAMYRSSMISGTSDTKPVFAINASMLWKVLKNKADISLVCSDIFNTMRMKVYNQYLGQNIKLDMGKYSRNIGIKFTYRFGGKISREKNEPNTDRFKQ